MEDNKIQISGIQHFLYCKRQWALFYIENIWQDNFLTLDGDKVHEKVHNPYIKESRKDKFIERGVYISSEKYNLTGQCDAIEYIRDSNGIQLKNKNGCWIIVPVEYKHGDGKSLDIDKYQLFAQILCLEEIFQCPINYGYLYYKKTNKKILVNFDNLERNKTLEIINEINLLFKQQKTPKTKYSSKKCKNCSLLEKCNPKILETKDINNYLKEAIDK